MTDYCEIMERHRTKRQCRIDTLIMMAVVFAVTYFVTLMVMKET